MRRAVGLPDVPGVLVVRVQPDGPAAAAGISSGDLATAAGGEVVQTIADLDRAVRSATSELELELLRGAEPRSATVKLHA